MTEIVFINYCDKYNHTYERYLSGASWWFFIIKMVKVYSLRLVRQCTIDTHYNCVVHPKCGIKDN